MKRAMRRMRKYLIVVACIALVAGLAIGGTVAWLVDDSEEVTNTFTSSNVNVDLQETVKGPFQIVPSVDLKKDPAVTVKETDVASFVFVTVTPTADWKFNSPRTFTAIGGEVSCSVDEYWNYLPTEDDVYVYYKALPANSPINGQAVLAALSNSDVGGATIDVADTITLAEMQAWAKEAQPSTMTFKAYIIQQAGFNGTEEADKALAAWNQAKNGVNGSDSTT